MSVGTQEKQKIELPDGFNKWAKTYFAKKVEAEIDPTGISSLFDSPYLRMRESVDTQLRNAKKVPELKTIIDKALPAIDEEEDLVKLQKLVGKVSASLKTSRTAVETA